MLQDNPLSVPQRNLRFDHLGVAVADLDRALEFYAAAFGYQLQSGPFEDPAQQAIVAFVSAGSDDYFVTELVAPLGENSHVSRLLEKNVGAYHVCYECDDIEGTLTGLSGCGCVVLRSPTPAVAYGGRRIAWLFTPARQLIELVEADRMDPSS